MPWPSVGPATIGARSRSSRCRNTRTLAALSAVEGQLSAYPPLVFAGEARNLRSPAWTGGAGRGFPAARRGLRRELHRSERQQHQRQQHPRLPARVPADGGGAHLRRLGAGGEGRPHRRPVRQAALVADRKEERPGAAELSRRHHQRPGVHRRGAHARSGAADRGVPSFRFDAESRSRASPTAATPVSAASTSGCSMSIRAARSATSSSPTASPRRSPSCRPAVSIWKGIPSSRPRISIRATRRCCSASSRR